MKFEIVTIFPEFFRGPLEYGIVRRAQEAGIIEIGIHDLRAFAHDRHKTVDDRPFGGGEGMVLKPEPMFECVESLGVAPQQERLSGQARESVIALSARAIPAGSTGPLGSGDGTRSTSRWWPCGGCGRSSSGHVPAVPGRCRRCR